MLQAYVLSISTSLDMNNTLHLFQIVLFLEITSAQNYEGSICTQLAQRCMVIASRKIQKAQCRDAYGLKLPDALPDTSGILRSHKAVALIPSERNAQKC